MCILQNQCNVRLLKYKETSMNTKLDFWKCNKMYKEAQLRSDFRKKSISLAGAKTHESDYFPPAQCLGCPSVILNLF